LVHGVPAVVQPEIQAHVEKVLVDGRVDARRNHCPVRARLARRDGPYRENASQLDLVLDRTVLVEVPEEAVLVVADGRNAREYKPPGAPNFRTRIAIDVFPKDAVVLFVKADGVFDAVGLTVRRRENAIEVTDFAEAIAAQFERVR